MILLAIDCAASPCAAALYDTEQDRVLASVSHDIGKGHAEALTGVVETVLQEAGKTYGDLGLIAVTVGPGSFTGIRVGVAFARGLSLALSIPAIGITTLEGIAAEAAGDRPVLAAIDAGRGEIHGALYSSSGELLRGPFVTSPADAAFLADEAGALLAGSAADGDPSLAKATASIETYARLAAKPGRDTAKPRPLYLRDADAKPQQGFAVPRAEP